jgi:hypothetical protein
MKCFKCEIEQAVLVPWYIEGKNQKVCGRCAFLLYKEAHHPTYTKFVNPVLAHAQRLAK